jgi:uncharacterized membrane protein
MLFIMTGTLILAFASFRNVSTTPSLGIGQYFIPALCIIGLGVAGYLAYVEAAQTTAVCGPVGDCNTVQQSEYARLFGVIPIGILGMVGYVTILLSWLLGRIQAEICAVPSALLTFSLSTFGILFSIYLTFLEPFVIGATCI